MHVTVLCLALLLTGQLDAQQAASESNVSGDAVIRRAAGNSEIVITTTSRLAGAIHSLTWQGREFIDSTDHGRQLQSAASFDGGRSGEFWAECFNPTEAGSRRDCAGPTSSSRLLSLKAGDNWLETRTQMAFWLAPGESSSGHAALNPAVLSEHFVTKRVRIGYADLPHAIDYRVTFEVPAGERHRYAQFEALTGYMPADFSQFWRLASQDQLQPLDDGPGEQSLPVLFSTPDGRHAMGVYSPDQPSRGFEQAGYGRFRFAAEKVTKWNCVFRQREPRGIPAGKYAFQIFVAVGSRDDVARTLTALHKQFKGE